MVGGYFVLLLAVLQEDSLDLGLQHFDAVDYLAAGDFITTHITAVSARLLFQEGEALEFAAEGDLPQLYLLQQGGVRQLAFRAHLNFR